MEIFHSVQLYVFLATYFKERCHISVVLVRRSFFSFLVQECFEKDKIQIEFYRSYFWNRRMVRDHYEMDRIISMEQVVHFPAWVVRVTKCLLFLGYLFSQFILDHLSSALGAPNKILKSRRICALVFSNHPTHFHNCLPWVVPFADNLRNIPGNIPGNIKDEILTVLPANFGLDAWRFYEAISGETIEYDYSLSLKYLRGNQNNRRVGSYAFKFFLKNLYLYRRLWMRFDSLWIWMHKYAFEWFLQLSHFEALFYVRGVKILWTMNEDTSDTQHAAIAIHRLGGVCLGTSWSETSFPQWNIQKNDMDIFFARGERSVQIRSGMKEQNIYYIVAGYPGDVYFQDEIRRAKEYREGLLRKHPIKHILTFIDNKASNDFLTSKELMRDIYQRLLDWVEEEAGNFIIVKTKTLKTLDKMPDLMEKILFYIKRGKASIVEEKGVLYPGLSADAVFGISSITLTSLMAVLKKPAIFYDHHHLLDKFPLGISNGTIISKIEEIIPTIRDAMKNHSWALWDRDQPYKGSTIDPFVDGKAAWRMRKYIELLAESYKGGDSREAAVGKANDDYQKKWGENYVVDGTFTG